MHQVFRSESVFTSTMVKFFIQRKKILDFFDGEENNGKFFYPQKKTDCCSDQECYFHHSLRKLREVESALKDDSSGLYFARNYIFIPGGNKFVFMPPMKRNTSVKDAYRIRNYFAFTTDVPVVGDIKEVETIDLLKLMDRPYIQTPITVDGFGISLVNRGEFFRPVLEMKR